jgi:hypothetical protein
MLTTALITAYVAAGRGRQPGETRAGAIRRKASGDTGALLVGLLIAVLALLRFVGACTIFARSNPKMPNLWLGLTFLLFLIGFSDIYLLYFSLRWGVTGLRGLFGQKVTDYTSLPYPRGSALSSRKA